MKSRLIPRILDRVPAPIRPYLTGVLLWAGLMALSVVLLRTFGAQAASVGAVLFLLLILGAAWLGYGPGMLVYALSVFVTPRILAPNRPRVFDPIRIGLVVVILLLISRISASKRRTEESLRRAAESLEERVAQRTQEISRNEERLREQAQLLDLATDAILVKDQDAVIQFWSHGAGQMYGWTAEEAVGHTAHDLLGTLFSEPLDSIEAKLLAAGAWQGELTHTRKDGTRITVMSRWALRRDGKGEACGSLEINTDVTTRRRIEEQLRQAQKMEAIGRLAGGISHDFNNLLTVINGYADMVLEELPPGSPLRGSLVEISGAGRRAAELTHGLLAFSRQQMLQPAVVDLNSVIRNIEKMLRRLLGEDIRIVTALAPDLWEVHADRGQLDQVIMNLAVNARDAMPGGGTLTIETANTELDGTYARQHLGVQAGAYAMLAVSDTGHGMDAQTQAQIFEPFFTTKGPGKGTGLGLATVYGIVQQSGGSITVYSEVGHGSSFKMFLPRLTAADAEPSRGVAAAAAGAPVPTGSETVLLVEDEDSLRKLTRAMLERHGFRVIAARGGDEALDLCRRANGAISIVLSDLVMPQMNGLQLAAELRRQYPQMKFVFMSGYTEHSVVNRISLDPEASFISKPFTAANIVNALNKALGRPERSLGQSS